MTLVVTVLKCISIIFTHDIFSDMTLHKSNPQEKQDEGKTPSVKQLTCIVCDSMISERFYFLLCSHFERTVRFSSGVSEAGSLMHGNMGLSVF